MKLLALIQLDREITKGKNKLFSEIVDYLIKEGIEEKDIDSSDEDCIQIYTDENYHYHDITDELKLLDALIINSSGDKVSYITLNK